MGRLVAVRTLEKGAEEAVPSVLGQNPRADLPRRVVPNVLRVPARQLGDPVPFVVQVISDDRLLQCSPRSAAASRRLPRENASVRWLLIRMLALPVKSVQRVVKDRRQDKGRYREEDQPGVQGE